MLGGAEVGYRQAGGATGGDVGRGGDNHTPDRAFVGHGDRHGSRVEEEHVGAVVEHVGADGIVVTGGILVDRGKAVPAGFVGGVAVGGDKVYLDRVGGGDHGVDGQAAVDQQRIAFIEGYGGAAANSHHGAVFSGGDGHTGVLKHVVGKQVLAHWNQILGAPVGGVVDFDRAGVEGGGAFVPGEPGHGDRPAGDEFVFAVVLDVGRVSGYGKGGEIGDDLAGGQDIVRGGGTGRTPGATIGDIAVAPDFGGGLNRVVDIGFIAVLPVVVGDGATRGQRHNADHTYLIAIGPRSGNGDRSREHGEDVVVRERHVVGLGLAQAGAGKGNEKSGYD